MPSISFDAQSLLIDGRRVWLASGALHYARTPRGLWAQRIAAARQAGLNCIETYVFWNRHESQPGVFDFEGDNDLRHFVQLVGAAGMYCILRPGPYVCAEWDFGGLPAWLHRLEGLRLRQANGPFMEAAARYLGAVMEQVRDLQVTTSIPAGTPSPVPGGGGGPIILVQVENEWFCHNPPQEAAYLRELVRYLRENGCNVPVTNCNNLWQRVDGTIDTWNANQNLASDLRQLAVVQPNAPRLVSEYWSGWFDAWGAPRAASPDAGDFYHRLGQILASGAQYNLYMFHGGTNFGFDGGRSVARPDCFITTSYDWNAPLGEAGRRGPKYLALKRLSTFVSQFGSLLAHLEPDRHHAAAAIDQPGHPLTVVHQRGTQGQVVFVFRDRDDRTPGAPVFLPNGLRLPVAMGADRVAWFVLDANLAGTAELTYTNLRPWAFLERRMLVLFGPAGSDAVVCINGAPLVVQVPTGRQPLVRHHEGLTLTILNTEQVDAAYLAGADLVLGAAALDAHGQPIPRRDWPNVLRIDVHGKMTAARTRPVRLPAAPRLGRWQHHTPTAVLTGASDRFRDLDGPASLEELGCNLGYGWYRLINKRAASGRMLAPQSGDRLHLFRRGRPAGVLGLGPGARFEPGPCNLTGTTVVLADNLGRFNFGWHLGEKKGLYSHFHVVRDVKLPRPAVTRGPLANPFALGQFWTNLRLGEHRMGQNVAWSLRLTGRHPLVLDIDNAPLRAVVLVNGRPLANYDQVMSAGYLRLFIDAEHLRAGRNELRLSLLRDIEPPARLAAALKGVRLFLATANATAKAAWAFTPWAPPAAEDFASRAPTRPGLPRWHRAMFRVSSTAAPLFFEPRGLSKGQIYLNGHNVGRYFVATAAGKKIPPQERYYLPEPWLCTDGLNELMLFDEHGKSSGRCRLVYHGA